MFYVLYFLSWTLALIIFGLGSAYLHELSHYIVARAAGFQIAGYRFMTVPFRSHGYVDVRIRGRFTYLPVRKALMHGSGLAIHLVLTCLSLKFFLVADSFLWKGNWLTGLAVNLYLFIINCVPAHSDGQKIVELVRGELFK